MDDQITTVSVANDTLRFLMTWTYASGDIMNVRMWLIGPSFRGGNYYMGGGTDTATYDTTVNNALPGTYYLVAQGKTIYATGPTVLDVSMYIYKNRQLVAYWRAGLSYELTSFQRVPTEPDPITVSQYFVSHDLDTARIEVLGPSPTTIDTFITAIPAMPSLQAKCRLKNYNGGNVTFGFRYLQKWVNAQEDPDRVIRDEFSGSVTVQNTNFSTWTIPWGNKTRGGDIDTLDITATTAQGGVYKKKIAKPYRILGKNPTRAEVKNGITLVQQVIIYNETFLPRWGQFREAPLPLSGFPMFGPPHGYGLSQLDDPRATDQQVWHWRDNRQAGTDLIAEKRNDALNSAATWRVRTRLPRSNRRWLPIGHQNPVQFTDEEMVTKETFQRYNGHRYHKWYPDNPWNGRSSGHWSAAPPPPPPGHAQAYGDECWGIYTNVQNGNPPVDWN